MKNEKNQNTLADDLYDDGMYLLMVVIGVSVSALTVASIYLTITGN